MHSKILAMIPARGGSKGVPRKNIKILGQHPLIAYTILTALEAKDVLSDIVVSTEDSEIAMISKKYGAQVPFLRPIELAQDSSKMYPVVCHCLEFQEKLNQCIYDAVMILQPTVPFRVKQDLENIVSIGMKENCDSVISVVPVFAHHPLLMKKIENKYLKPFFENEPEGTRRQDYEPKAFMRNGSVYFIKRQTIIEKKSLWGEKIIPYIMPDNLSINIDSEIDFKLAEIYLKELNKNLRVAG